MSQRGVIFFNAGSKHGVHLAVAVATLRNHYDGPVALITEQAGPGRDACERIAEDSRLGPIQVIADQSLKSGGHGVSYFSKTLLPRLSPFDVTLFLDADVMVIGSLDELWPDEASGEVCLTQFADWQSQGGKMRQRIEPWREVEPARVERMLEKKWPAINTGVLSWSKQSESFAEDWTMTCRKRMCFMADETAAQLIFPDHPHKILDDRFNASIIYPRSGQDIYTREDVRLVHFHGGKAWKRPQGQHFYLPVYEHCLRENYGGICAIAPHPKWFNALPEQDRQRLKRYFHSSLAAVC